jgi:hypothetical protein
MKKNVIHAHMERTARTLLLWNVLLIAVVVAGFLFSFRYFYNFVLGPFPMDRGELLAIEDPGSQFRYFVTIVGDEGIQTGAARLENKVVKQSYNLILIHDRLLFVESEGTTFYGKEATGALVAIPYEIRRKIVDPTLAKNPELRNQVLPFMLDATSFRLPGIIGILVGVSLIGVGGWNIRRALIQLGDVNRHPMTKVLAQFGNPAEVARDIDAEHDQGEPARFGDITMTRSWMVRKSRFNLFLARLDQTLWVYKKVTRHSVNFIPAGSTHAVVVWFRGANFPIELQMRERVCDDLLDFFTKRVPWALFGFEYTLDAHMRRAPWEIADAVAAREQEFKSAAARENPTAER